MTGAALNADRIWQTAMADLALACASAEAAQTGELLRKLHALMGMGALEWAWLATDLPDSAEIDAAIVADAAIGGAIALTSGRAGYMISQGIGGRAMASVVLDGAGEEAHGEGPNAAIALIAAMAAALAGPALNNMTESQPASRPQGALLN